jgi:hypothetical protein
MKHCTTATKKSPWIKMGLKKKEVRALYKNIISWHERKMFEEGKKETSKNRQYVL